MRRSIHIGFISLGLILFVLLLRLASPSFAAPGLQNKTNNGMPNRGISPTQSQQCHYEVVKCIKAPCRPILVCDSPLPTAEIEQPERKACTQAIKDLHLTDSCDNKKFKYAHAEYTCADGTTGTLGDTTTCTTVSHWIQIVRKACAPHRDCRVTPPGDISTSPTPPTCLKIMGDANCDGQIDMIDFEIFRQEYIGETHTLQADFNNDGSVNLVDFEIWRMGMFGEVTPSVTGVPQPITCGWCGRTCTDVQPDKMCPMVMPEAGKVCSAVEENGQVTCVESAAPSAAPAQ
jgi:hypothetical protein